VDEKREETSDESNTYKNEITENMPSLNSIMTVAKATARNLKSALIDIKEPGSKNT
jgi:hypothetical protein